MNIDHKWLEFLREQYPAGSRIKLKEMKDLLDPVKPGTLGTLDCIDDVGTFHVTWDNGRTLGLVIGEDSFSVLPPETALLKLYMPMTVDYYERDEWGNTENEPCEMPDAEAAAFVDNIAAALLRERLPEESERGLMTYFDRDEAVNEKVRSYRFVTEARAGRLWGVAECQVAGELTPEELAALKEAVAGQASDGFGEGFEQHEIKLNDGRELYAHLWQGDNWSIKTEQEQFSQMQATSEPKAGGMEMR